MAANKATIRWSYKDKKPNYEVDMHIDLSRFEKQFQQAQYELDNMVMTSMVPFMPMQTEIFINVTKAMSAALAGSGVIVAAAPPMGRFLYEGEIMVDPETGSPYARAAAKKILASEYSQWEGESTKLDFNRTANPDAQSHWFEAAKKEDGEKWVEKAKKKAGGG